jgi:hypothetical protein
VITEIEANEEAEFYDLLFAVMLPQGVEKGGVNRFRIRRYQLAVAQRELIGSGKPLACGVVVDAFVQQLFG